MAALYVDTSALGRVLLGEPDRAAILRELTRFDQTVSSRLLGVELRRLALRSARLDAIFDYGAFTRHAGEIVGRLAKIA